MPPPAPLVPPGMPTLHLYRHLLRQISYLPPAFSDTIRSRVRAKFHKHSTTDVHQQKRRARARALLRSMTAANNGDAKPMASIMDKAFGRTGWRRRKLLDSFSVTQGPSDSSLLEVLLSGSKGTASCFQEDGSSAASTEKMGSTASAENGASSEASEQQPVKKPARNHPFLERWDRDKLKQFIASQRKAQNDGGKGLIWPSSELSRGKEDSLVPAVNTWGKPPAESLVRTKIAKWWIKQADKIMPPVGKGEWDLLGQLSRGAQERSDWMIPARRTPARPLAGPPAAGNVGGEGEKGEEPAWDWEAYATNSASFVEPARMVLQRRYQAGAETGPYGGRKRRSKIPDRWFRRAYLRTWRKTSYVEQDPGSLKHNFKWGEQDPVLVAPNKWQQRFLDEVDEQGKPLKGGAR